ncbi:hypothetical protein KCP74_02080 [Salmonella enterica subsp. enterica]|nr:hypothetical protein KCP74_02080 [Salmonella enterica subsp. enterica]
MRWATHGATNNTATGSDAEKFPAMHVVIRILATAAAITCRRMDGDKFAIMFSANDHFGY